MYTVCRLKASELNEKLLEPLKILFDDDNDVHIAARPPIAAGLGPEIADAPDFRPVPHLPAWRPTYERPHRRFAGQAR
jgi:hypothetical protein